MKWIVAVSLMLTMTSCTKPKRIPLMNTIGFEYVKLVLRVGQYDADYIDAYFGPDEWRPKGDLPADTAQALNELLSETHALQNELRQTKTSGFNDLSLRRHRYLTKQLIAVECKIRMLQGERFSFDEESRSLYDAVAPTYDEKHYDVLLTELDKLLPGSGDLSKRLESFRSNFIIPKDKLDVVFSAAIEEGRRITKKHIPLADSESFLVEYVTDKPWSGYNWYKGKSHSVIQVNTDFPISIERAVDLACHEGYPGHHVYNALLEQHLAVEQNWPEFRVYVLFSPQSFIAEGSANYGIEAAFSPDARIRFEKEVLFPLAGLDSSKADEYYQVLAVTAKLNYAGNEAARGYLNGTMSKEDAIAWLQKYSLSSKERAEQRIRFIDKYRSYVINYNWGLDLVRNYVDKQSDGEEAKRWQVLEELLSRPFVPSELVQK